MSDSYKGPRGQIGIVTKPDGSPQWLYAWEQRGGSAYAIVWVLVDRPGTTLAYVGTESGGKWLSIADLARAVPGAIGAASELETLAMQNGNVQTAPLQGFTVYKSTGGDLGFSSVEVMFDPFAFGTPTLLAQIGRAPERAEPPVNGVRATPREAATAIGLPPSGSDSALVDSSMLLPVAPTAPPTFGDAGGGGAPPAVGKLPTSAAVPALALLGAAAALLVLTKRAR